jgi:hypothetical protein
MNESIRSLLRRIGLGCVGILCLGGSLVLTPVAATSATHAGSAAAYDRTLDEGDCALLGRKFSARRGCSRAKCVAGAVLWRKTFGAEACALKGAPRGYGFVSTIDINLCQALHRRWIPQVNYCASLPDRSSGPVYYAPQCTGTAIVYVPLSETEGFYDECLTQDRVGELARLAMADSTTLAGEVAARSSVQCPYRPRHVYLDGVCMQDPAAQPSGGGVVMIGDSLTWRGSDELGRLQPTLILDGEPARPANELAGRLASFRALHGEPDGLIIELGTVPSKGFGRRDLVKVVRSLPKRTEVMFVLPYYELSREPVVVTPQSKRVDRWMREIGRSRRHSCAADWPSYVGSHPSILQDGVHMKHVAEGRWAHWIARQWARC